jgi:hypothetical protein
VVCCLGLGLLVGLFRLALPLSDRDRNRGRGHRRGRRCAAVADFCAVGLACLLVQSYAAGKSDAGGVRWYMLAGAACGAGAVLQLLGPTVRRAQAMLAKNRTQLGCFIREKWRRFASHMPRRKGQTAQDALRSEESWRAPGQVRQTKKEQKILAKNDKKILQTQGQMLYNSHV